MDNNYVYRGWNISYSSQRPVTGVYAAELHGVELSGGSRDAIEPFRVY
jgi:hypothetical protein